LYKYKKRNLKGRRSGREARERESEKMEDERGCVFI
jgi:hypothetical protein